MNKEDEKVLVFPACYQKHLIGLPGFVSHEKEPGNWEAFVKEIIPKATFMRRGDVEDDPSMNQIIPYVIIRTLAGRVLMYNRGKKGGEQRLADKWSIGIGGHINPEDTPTEDLPEEIIYSSAGREVSEELEGVNIRTMSSIGLLGFLFTIGTPVDAVHFGAVLHTVCLIPGDIEATDEATQLKWLKPEELKEYELEKWSMLIRDEYLLKEK